MSAVFYIKKEVCRMENYIEKTLNNLRKNNMEAYYAENIEEALEKVKDLIPKGASVSVGGSVTLFKTGIIDLLKSGDYDYLDRYKEGLTKDQVADLFRKVFSCDVYLSSTNAVTEEGVLYNVDGNSNRVAAILYGPKSVIIISGKNKIVPTEADAVMRVKTTAAPLNATRLKMATPCTVSGECMSLNKDDPEICDGCGGDNRICCNYVFTGRQRNKNRIKVILVNEDLGY